MEVKSCKIESFYCIWLEKGHFNIEAVDFRRQVLKNQLRWFINALLDLAQNEKHCFFLKNGRDADGTIRLTKFRASSGWVVKCVARNTSGFQSFVHVYTGVEMLRCTC